MNPKEKGKFNEALKLYDNKEYKNSRKACDKILEKQPTNEDALALKGLVLCHLNEKEDGAKLISQALKINMKNPTSWHFFALFHKEDKNYSQALKCYLQAYKNEPNNFNVIRDLSYLQLYLRQFNAFAESSKKAVDSRPHMLVNWVTYAFANYLTGNYEAAIRLLDSCEKISPDAIKKPEKNEIVLFQSEMYCKMGKYDEALAFILKNANSVIDKTLFTEKIIAIAILAGNRDIGLEYVNKAFKINSENISYFLSYFNLNMPINTKHFKTYRDLFSNLDMDTCSQLLTLLQEDLKPRLKSKIIDRLELVFAQDEKFKQLFSRYFLYSVKANLPSFFINVKSIYIYQPHKIPIIEEFLSEHLESIKQNGYLEINNTNGEALDTVPQIIWVYFYAAQHYDFCMNLEKALYYINLAIDSTPSVVEFYMCKSRILKHAGMLEESALTYDKAKKLDLGDRYLNAKHAKCYVRLCDVSKSLEIMKEFVRDPLSDENIDHIQCMWYEYECGSTYLRTNKILHAHRLFKNILNHFHTIIDDQFDFYNYCLRRFMINDFYKTIEYMDTLLTSKYVYKSLNLLDTILIFLQLNLQSPQLGKQLDSEFEEMQKEKYEKYKFNSIAGVISDIENEIYSFCKALQAHSRDISLHKICVKYFLVKNKPILALKSLKFLEGEYLRKQNYFFLDALFIFNDFLSHNRDKIPQMFLDMIYQSFDVLKTGESVAKFITAEKESLVSAYVTNGLILEGMMINAYEIVHQKYTKEDLEKVIANGLEFDIQVLRRGKFEDVNELWIYLSMFCEMEFKEKWKEEFRKKIMIICDEKDVNGNLTFWQ